MTTGIDIPDDLMGLDSAVGLDMANEDALDIHSMIGDAPIPTGAGQVRENVGMAVDHQ